MSQKIFLIDQFVCHFSTIFECSANTKMFKDSIYFLNNSINASRINNEIFISKCWLSLKDLKFVEKTLSSF